MKQDPEIIANGVDELVRRLRRDGVEAAERESETILTQAREQAAHILAEAQQQAEEMLSTSRQQLAREQRAAEEALLQSYRDLVLAMKTEMLTRVADDVHELVGECVAQPEVLEKMVLELVGRIRDEARIPDDARIEVALPSRIMGLEDIRRDPDSAKSGPMAEFTRELMAKILREGVSFGVEEGEQKGVRLRLVDCQMEVDVTDEAIAELLLRYLHPRFRAILDGILH